MNKMIKGAAFAGIGVALLMGGGGTLAAWNATDDANAGTIKSGQLALTAQEGVWTDAADNRIDVAEYRIIPGEVLTYTQVLDIVVEGTNMEASLAVDGAPQNLGFDGDTAEAGPIILKSSDGLTVSTLTESTKVTASTEFTFSAEDTDSMKAQYDFSGVKYVLTQVTSDNDN